MGWIGEGGMGMNLGIAVKPGIGAMGRSAGCGIAMAGFIAGKLGVKEGPLRNAGGMKPIGTIMGIMNPGGIAILFVGAATDPGVAIQASMGGFARFGDGVCA